MNQPANYIKETLPNGLRIITAPMPASRSVTLMVMVGAGSRYEEKRINGISHFMEHMFFKGAKRYPDAMAVASAIDSIGGVFNAFTSEEKVAYFVKLSSGKKETGYDLLSDMLLNSKFDAEEIDRERGVIIEEIRMYNDDPMSRVQMDFKAHFYGDQPLGWDIAGPEENIHSIQREDFLAFRDTFYPASSCVVVAGGGIKHEEHRALVERYFNFSPNGKKQSGVPYVPMPGKRSTLTTRDIEQAHLIIGFPTPGEEHDDQPVLKVLSNILGGTMSSRLFYQVRERRGLAYYIRSARSTYTDAGGLKISAGINVAKVEEAITCVMAELAKLCDAGVSADELAKGKENIKGRTDLSLEDSMSVAGLYASHEVLYGRVKTPEDLAAEVDSVTTDAIQSVARKYLTPDKARMAVLGPFDDLTPYDNALGA